MALKAKEVGKTVRYATFFNLASATDLEIKIIGGPTEIIIPLARISVPNAQVTDNVLGVLPANTYMQFKTISTDFPIGLTYTLCGKYNDGTPKEFYGDIATIIVEGSCYS